MIAFSSQRKAILNSRIGRSVLCVVFRELPDPSADVLLQFFGDHKAVVRPVPIPNTAVKRCLADGSGCIASARVGCLQIKIKTPELVPAFLFGKPLASSLEREFSVLAISGPR